MRSLSTLLLLSLCLIVAACGQKGPLYLPQSQTSSQLTATE